MTQSELKQKLTTLVEEYFGAATVSWGMTRTVSSHVPQIVLSMGTLQRHYHPITRSVNGVPINAYPSQATLQVDLYTMGVKTKDIPGVKSAYDNTAVNDMTDFVNFLGSAYVDNWTGQNDLSILVSEVRDLTALINDTTWDYRAMIEIEVGFTQSAVGYTGIMWENGVAYGEDGRPLAEQPEFKPTPSGGRTLELAGNATGWFEQVETEFIKEED